MAVTLKTIKLNKSERRIFSLSFFVLISLSFLLLFCKSSAIRGEEAKDATSDASSSETIQGATIDDAPFEGSNILGVASNYNGFAAGNMYISGGSVTELEGRYAANEIKADTDYAGWGFSSVKWGTVTTLDEKSITPLFTANKIAPNITSDNKISSNLLKVQKGSGDEQTYVFNGNNKIIANNLFKYINPAKTWTRGMKITSQVTKDGKVLYETNKTEAGMAPQSNFNYAITTNHQALQSGTFHLKMVIELEGKKWVFDKDFTITKERAEAVNKDSVIEKNYTWIWILVGVLLILLLLYGIYRWGKRQGSKQQTSN